MKLLASAPVPLLLGSPHCLVRLHAVVLAVALFSLRPAVLCSFGCRAANHRCSITDRAMQPLFQPFRALGHISDDVPFAVQRRGKETFVTVSVGKAWQVGAQLFPH